MNLMILMSMVVLVLMDQLTKIWAVNVLATGRDIYVWKDVFHLHYISNYGAAWGILSGKQIFLIILTSVIILAMVYYMLKMPHSRGEKWIKIAFVLIISGAIGNLIDRIQLGYVRDFLYFVLIDFPIFNVADICVVCGVTLLIFTLIGEDLQEKKRYKNGRMD